MKIICWYTLYVCFCFLIWSCSSAGDQTQHPSPQFVQGYDEPVRGVWLTNVASEALYSNENVVEAVAKIDSLGFNTIFMVTWNKAMTMYRSNIMKNVTGHEIDPALDPDNAGRDPLQEVIDEAHKRDIKVFAWFEFGFAASYKHDGGVLIKKKPKWASLDVNGDLVEKNGFEWMNALNPEVQDFMLSLVLEVARNYVVDGIQGDDRLPAMPTEGGYNPEVIEAYKKDHFGQAPPDYHKDFRWIHWRADQLNKFMKQLYQEVKAVDSSLVVSMSPSVYPWSKEQYLQDWPTWVNFGYVDMIVPQVYRKDSASYAATLASNIKRILPGKRHLFYPGILIKVGDQQPSEELFQFMLEENRRHNIPGEVHFYYEGLETYADIINTMYNQNR